MYIVDKQIKELCSQNKLIIENYNPNNVGAVSYDLTINHIVLFDEESYYI